METKTSVLHGREYCGGDIHSKKQAGYKESRGKGWERGMNETIRKLEKKYRTEKAAKENVRAGGENSFLWETRGESPFPGGKKKKDWEEGRRAGICLEKKGERGRVKKKSIKNWRGIMGKTESSGKKKKTQWEKVHFLSLQ